MANQLHRITRRSVNSFRIEDARDLLHDRLVDLVYGNCTEAIGLIENTVVEAGAAREFRSNYDAVVEAARTEPFWSLRTKNSDNRYVQEIRKMHRATVIAHKEIASGKQRYKRAKVQAHRVAALQ